MAAVSAIQSLQSKIKSLENELFEKNATCHRLQEMVSQANEHVYQLEKDLSYSKIDADREHQKVIDLERLTSQLQAELISLKTKENSVIQTNHELEQRISMLSKDIKAIPFLKEQIAALQKLIDQERSMGEKWKKDKKDLNEANSILMKSNKQLAKTLSSLSPSVPSSTITSSPSHTTRRSSLQQASTKNIQSDELQSLDDFSLDRKGTFHPPYQTSATDPSTPQQPHLMATTSHLPLSEPPPSSSLTRPLSFTTTPSNSHLSSSFFNNPLLYSQQLYPTSYEQQKSVASMPPKEIQGLSNSFTSNTLSSQKISALSAGQSNEKGAWAADDPRQRSTTQMEQSPERNMSQSMPYSSASSSKMFDYSFSKKPTLSSFSTSTPSSHTSSSTRSKKTVRKNKKEKIPSYARPLTPPSMPPNPKSPSKCSPAAFSRLHSQQLEKDAFPGELPEYSYYGRSIRSTFTRLRQDLQNELKRLRREYNHLRKTLKRNQMDYYSQNDEEDESNDESDDDAEYEMSDEELPLSQSHMSSHSSMIAKKLSKIAAEIAEKSRQLKEMDEYHKTVVVAKTKCGKLPPSKRVRPKTAIQ
eukprot:MONOS_109.1-p1 / transcript=MONOS_109.1 / gene=MONOS_109 / organism=Monocercomonoides_exilis_PA203 / gene_product=unspecified product / transcript_product=unspecified product / location=Mono_scaffold00002:149324-151536(-) / protein_length=585 / sequence_SO=supercontig / SO=protein_coding / is_pseudo=false